MPGRLTSNISMSLIEVYARFVSRYGIPCLLAASLATTGIWGTLAGAQSLPSAFLSRTSSAPPELIAGQVVNARTGTPLPRVLVQMGSRAMLTDAEGRFRFDQPDQPASSLRFTKPGYSTSPEQTDGSPADLSSDADPASLTVALWPEAILTGTVLAPDGEPLPRIPVAARRSVFDEQGHHLQTAGQAQTDSHGQFRIPVTAGDYVVDTAFSQGGPEPGQAVLPARFPSNSDPAQLLHLRSGEEQTIELRPVVARTHLVTVPVDGGEGMPPRITIRSRDGSTFSANAFRSQEEGSIRLELPSGTYSLHGTRFGREGLQFGETSVTVPDHDVTASPLHLTSTPGIPIDLVVDASGTSAPAPGGVRSAAGNPPNLMQFNLALDPIDPDPASPFQFRPTPQRDGGATLSAPPGAYRLNASLSGGWYIHSATSRGTDLLRDDLLISPGASPSPITVVVSSQTGNLEGVVTLSGAPAACWVYLIANGPTLPAVVIRRSDRSGQFHIPDLPPGSYRAVAFPYRHSANLQEPSILNQFSTHIGAVSVSPGRTATLNLDAVTNKELAP